MSLRERFPRAALNHAPDPELFDVDPEPASAFLRQAFLESVRKFEPDARLDAFANVRLFGRGITDGVFDKHAAEIFLRLQNEISSAANSGDLDAVNIGFSTVAEGSVIMHLHPASPLVSGTDEMEISAPSPLEVALLRVLDLHDAVETGNGEAAIGSARSGLAARLRQLVESLDDADAGIEIDISKSSGARRKSVFTESGRKNARALLKPKDHVTKGLIIGTLKSASTAGKIEIQVNRRSAVEIVDVPPGDVKKLPWDRQLRVRVRIEQLIDPAASRSKVTNHFLELISHDEIIPDSEARSTQ
ncbi:hypothetical protein C1M55_21165 [Rhodococcus qingshengii]|uniref:hypothetical protein n=1 Tax=Rhodococcus TaxID=1827 RepID=UPI00097663F8|nr:MULTISPECIES: hypothetical protein [Rhodococcus]AUS33350.1 hypothetical protein C1M55_21165 [Rhodococcus qingshengii]MCC4305755.1 hypothetical protein [Rhodococcus sp. 3-2]OMQ38018.1 hypothetical protein BK799_01075 [Rhodococcus sp. D-1]